MRHILALSGGKDSTALAIYMAHQYPEIPMEYVFTDTDRELPEIYTFLDELEARLGITIHRINDYGRGFDYYLPHWNYFLPGKRSRWCTKHLKIRPMERFCKQQLPATVYIGIRADEEASRGNYGLAVEGITYRYPFREDGLVLEDIWRLWQDAELTLPAFYAWRTTGGCYMCPWQRESEWLGLQKHHPALFAQAVKEEKHATASSADGHATTWSLSRKPLLKMLDEYERQSQLFPDYEFDLRERFDSRPCLICAK